MNHYTGESGLPGVAHTVRPDSPEARKKFVLKKTHRCALTLVSHESNLQGLPMLLEEQFLKKQTVGVKDWIPGRDSCLRNFSSLIHRSSLHPGADLKCKQLYKSEVKNLPTLSL